ncbi:MAG: hypothetical protein LBL91_06355 [Lachnospiraceae bacterium]|jgi:hypothetical protein|nr:hypothetical protein [Lachnospiraceae bacterium]
MADYTSNYNLILPKETENYDIGVANANNRIIDNALGNKVEKIAGKDLSTNDFTDGYKNKVDAMQRLYTFKGSVQTYSDLEAITGKTTGDVWNVLDDNTNYCWNGQAWIDIGLAVDMSAYATNATHNVKSYSDISQLGLTKAKNMDLKTIINAMADGTILLDKLDNTFSISQFTQATTAILQITKTGNSALVVITSQDDATAGDIYKITYNGTTLTAPAKLSTLSYTVIADIAD